MLGFIVAIWQILKVKRAADAARDAALGLASRVRSRELLAKLGDVRTHLDAARNHVTNGERQIVILCLETAYASAIDAEEILRGLDRDTADLQRFSLLLRQLTEQITAMPEPLGHNAEFVRLRTGLS
ncbi:MAG: hypothetical protein ACREFH_05525, partial [Stellaceae bacterium]